MSANVVSCCNRIPSFLPDVLSPISERRLIDGFDVVGAYNRWCPLPPHLIFKLCSLPSDSPPSYLPTGPLPLHILLFRPPPLRRPRFILLPSSSSRVKCPFQTCPPKISATNCTPAHLPKHAVCPRRSSALRAWRESVQRTCLGGFRMAQLLAALLVTAALSTLRVASSSPINSLRLARRSGGQLVTGADPRLIILQCIGKDRFRGRGSPLNGEK
ncbi:hypothetical protein BDK51DRAFT_42653 [Blyttiomyces helicus]|uniref:Uncharacterized protein n=1 Tax=Blyttiomyces helicus TaxID=388810 RepID=A0A4P9WA59_9FUNG|nr:hypothetical protein BDK51DRAFT_42653 [Blyttiomyces helicus]|eukprot:RKO89092.1 hypothetical protein BDK51DRAFT_42653 [Blyttiomyces helicus]